MCIRDSSFSKEDLENWLKFAEERERLEKFIEGQPLNYKFLHTLSAKNNLKLVEKSLFSGGKNSFYKNSKIHVNIPSEIFVGNLSIEGLDTCNPDDNYAQAA